MKEEKYKEAIQCYTKAMELDSANAVFPCNRFALCGSRGCPLPPPHPMQKGFFIRSGNSNLPTCLKLLPGGHPALVARYLGIEDRS